MGKKKGRRQSDPSREEAESTDDENPTDPDTLTSCPHTGKAVTLAAIKKNLKISWVRVGQCAPCLKDKKMSGRSATLPKDKPGGKRTMQDIKKEQLERARQEQIKAAAKLKKDAEPEPGADKPSEDKAKVEDPAISADGTRIGPQEEPGAPAAVWLCLRCGSQACGANGKNHLAGHYKTPRSDLHCLFVNTETWSIFCFECNKDIYIDSHKKLYEAVEFIKKINVKPNKHIAPKTMMSSMSLPKLSGKDVKDQTNTAVQAGLLPKVKGLNNLGNTCFFNSVMQCLSQTHPLTQLIDIQSSKGANFSVKVMDSVEDGILSEDENDNLDFFTVPDLSIQLQEGGPMVTSLAAFLKEMHSAGKSTTISPSHLFGQVVKQSPKFRGMQQQDSQELLRYLLDGLRNEEAKRQKAAVLKYFGFSEKSDPKSVPRNIRKKLKLYGRMSNHTLLDKLFSGQMVSTIVCEECHYSSQTYEPFLDLSLPVVEDKPHKPRAKNSDVLPDDDDSVRVTCCGAQDTKKSKSQLKKEKLKHKKESRRGGKGNPKSGEDKIQADMNENETKEEEKSANKTIDKPEDKAEDKPSEVIANPVIKLDNGGTKNIPKPGPEKKTADKKAKEDNRPPPTSWKDGNDEDDEEEGYEEEEEGWEWDYGETWEEDKKVEEKKTEEREDSDYVEPFDDEPSTEDDLPKPPLKSLNPLPPEMINNAEFEHEKSSERTGDNTDAETGASSNADIEDNDSDDSKKKWTNSKNVMDNMARLDPVQLNPSNLDPHMEELCKNIQLLNTNKETEEGSDPSTNYQTAESELKEEGVSQNKEVPLSKEDRLQRLRNEWTARTLVSLAPRYESSPGECSIYSCLNQFSQSELLTGSNKWACDSCTKIRDRADESDSSDKSKSSSPVYSNASKQILLFCPPVILTLHLRRYQQTLVGCRKINKHVSFPLTLDLAPFCSSTSLAMPIMQPQQTKVLYSLYGVVEHSGRLQGGHYTAFIKVRPANTSSRDMSQFFTSPVSKSSDIPRFLNQLQEKHAAAAKSPEPEPTAVAKRWFHVSDSNVNEVSEDRVLKAQAYLLFYERIL